MRQTSLYISDLDGTLLRSDATVPEDTRIALNLMIQEGLAFTVASGRSVVSIRRVLTGLHLTLPVIGFNGAFISDFASGRHHVIQNIALTVVNELYRCILDFQQLPLISTVNHARQDCLYYSHAINEGMQRYLTARERKQDKRLRNVNDLRCAFRDQVVCLTVIGRQAPLSELVTALLADFGPHIELQCQENPYLPGWYWLTIHDYNATKAHAIQRLRQMHRFEQHELVVFGDHANDLSMFQLADRPVAMANAIAEIKAEARHIAHSNEQNGVLRFLQHEWNTLS